MRYASIGVLAMLTFSSQVSRSQQIPASLAQAKLEGASFPRGAAPPVVMPTFADPPFGGTSERKCVSELPDDSLPGGSLRSGDIIIRTHFSGRWGLHAGQEHTILWMSFHRIVDRRDTLLVRAVRLGEPPDSLLQKITGMAGHHSEHGYPSTVRFPAAGRWPLGAAAGDDRGCFVLNVDP